MQGLCDTRPRKPTVERRQTWPGPPAAVTGGDLEAQAARQAAPLLAGRAAAAVPARRGSGSGSAGAAPRSSISGSSLHVGSAGRVALAAAAALLLGTLLGSATRGGAARPSPPPGGAARIVLLADTHLAGPEYPLNGETGQLDNAAITRTQQRFYRAVRAINAIAPPPQLAVFGGDVVHDGLKYLRRLGLNATGLRRLYREPVNGFKIAASLLGELRMPRLYVWWVRRLAMEGTHQGPCNAFCWLLGGRPQAAPVLPHPPCAAGPAGATTTTWRSAASLRRAPARRWRPTSTAASSMRRCLMAAGWRPAAARCGHFEQLWLLLRPARLLHGCFLRCSRMPPATWAATGACWRSTACMARLGTPHTGAATRCACWGAAGGSGAGGWKRVCTNARSTWDVICPLCLLCLLHCAAQAVELRRGAAALAGRPAGGSRAAGPARAGRGEGPLGLEHRDCGLSHGLGNHRAMQPFSPTTMHLCPHGPAPRPTSRWQLRCWTKPTRPSPGTTCARCWRRTPTFA